MKTMKCCKRLGSFLTAVLVCAGLLILPGGGVSAQQQDTVVFPRGETLTGSGYVSVAQSGPLELFADPATGAFYMSDAAAGQTLYSFPQDQDADDSTSGYNLFSQNSAFIIQYINAKKVTNETNAVVASVRKGGLTVNRTPGGVIFTYRMPEIGITIPVACVLRDGALEVSILVNEIKEEGEYLLLECALMPYLGSAGPQDTGYLVIPDGSGALIDFSPDSERLPSFQYKKAVYGRDPMNSVQSVSSDSEDIKLPVFAVKTAERAVLGIVTKGEALTSIEVFAKGSKTMQSAVHPVMSYRGTYARTLFDTSWEKRKAVIVAENTAAIDTYTVRYTLTGAADYTAIAAQVAAYYRSQDFGVNKARQTGSALYLQLLGAVKKPDSILGVPTDTVHVATDYQQAYAIAQKLLDGGVPGLQLVYQGMFAGGMYDKLPAKAKTEGKLGSKNQLAELQTFLASQNCGFFPAADLSAVYRSGNGISYQGDACRDFAGGYKEIFAFSPITFAPEEDGLSYTILSPAKVAGVYETFTKALAGKGFTAFADIGTNRLASDNHRSLFGKSRFVDREGAMEIQRAAIAGSAEKLDAVMASFAAGYLLPYVSSINDVPGVSSREDGFTREIPFYSLVASQFAQLAAEPLNFAGDTQTYLLRCLEYGLQPSAYISGSDTSELWNTKANWLYAADAGEMATKLTALYRDHGDALAITGASPLVSHQRLQDGVYKSGYASGKEIYVNYTDTEAAADGLTIPAHGYRTGGAA